MISSKIVAASLNALRLVIVLLRPRLRMKEREQADGRRGSRPKFFHAGMIVGGRVLWTRQMDQIIAGAFVRKFPPRMAVESAPSQPSSTLA